MKLGDKCKLPWGLVKEMGMGDLLPARWTVYKVEDRTIHISLDHRDLEVKLGPLMASMVEAWQDDDERMWRDERILEAQESMSPTLSELGDALAEVISDTELCGVDPARLVEARKLISEHLAILDAP